MGRRILLNVTDGSLAGGGIASMYRTSLPALRDLCVTNGWELLTVSGEPDSDTNRQFGFKSAGYKDRHEQAATFIANLMKNDLAGATVAVFIWGYASYFPYAFQPFLQNGAVTAMATADSSPPDTDQLGTDISTSRFVETAYDQTYQLVWSWHGYNEKDHRLVARTPRGAQLVQSGRPFPSNYLGLLRNETTYRPAYRQKWFGNEDQVVIVLTMSPDYWGDGGIGKWITQRQWTDVKNKTFLLHEALEEVGRQLSPRRLRVIANPAYPPQVAENFDLRLGQFPPESYRQLLTASDLAVIRTSCCVTSVECANLGTPQYLVLTPAFNYMNVEVFEDAARAHGIVLPKGGTIAEGILNALQGETEETRSRALLEAQTFDETHNFFLIIQRLLLH